MVMENMTEQDKDEMKEYLELARQSGKSETSGLVALILDRQEAIIQRAVKKHVNGTIKEIQEMLKQNTINLENYIIEDNKWKKENDPYLKGLANLTGGAKIAVWLAVAVSSVGGAWIVIKSLFVK